MAENQEIGYNNFPVTIAIRFLLDQKKLAATEYNQWKGIMKWSSLLTQDFHQETSEITGKK